MKFFRLIFVIGFINSSILVAQAGANDEPWSKLDKSVICYESQANLTNIRDSGSLFVSLEQTYNFAYSFDLVEKMLSKDFGTICEKAKDSGSVLTELSKKCPEDCSDFSKNMKGYPDKFLKMCQSTCQIIYPKGLAYLQGYYDGSSACNGKKQKPSVPATR